MNKVLKYTSIISSFILMIVVGILTIISTLKTDETLGFLYGYYSTSHTFIYVFAILTMIIMLISIIVFLLCDGIYKKINIKFQTATTFVILGFLVATILTYMVINLSSDTTLLNMIFSESTDYINSTIEANENNLILSLFFGSSINFLLIFSIIASIFQILILFYTFIDKSEGLGNQIKHSPKKQNKETTLSPTESIKQEIEDMKQAIELKKLKEEYSKLYNELNSNND